MHETDLSAAIKEATGFDCRYVWSQTNRSTLGIGFVADQTEPSIIARVCIGPERIAVSQRCATLLSALTDTPLQQRIEQLIYSGPLPGYGIALVTKYLQGIAWENQVVPASKQHWTQILGWLDDLAAVPTAEFSSESLNDRYSLEHLVSFYPEHIVRPWREALEELDPKLDTVKRVLCHGDLGLNNIIWQGERPVIIDWEWGHLGYLGRDLLTLRMHWLRAIAHLDSLPPIELVQHLTDTNLASTRDPFLARLKEIEPAWEEVFAYFSLTYAVRWCFDCVTSDFDWPGAFLAKVR